ncbi:MAG: hypothetical protein HFH49_03745 [Lachnospiraceae bacterium]|nr:hypothetical protein [Lachnospiraceae bacterium]
MGKEQFLLVNGSAFLGRPSPSEFTGAGLFKCDTGFFALVTIYMRTPVAIKGAQFFKCRNRKEVSVQQEQGITKNNDCMVSFLHHLYHMGSTGNSRATPCHPAGHYGGRML